MLFQSRIDRLKATQEKLERSIEDKKSRIHYQNSKIGAKIEKLEQQAFRNRTHLAEFTENVSIKLTKNAKLICAEADYANELGSKYQEMNKENKTKRTTKK